MYNHLKIDMDYCADPIWVSNDPIDEVPGFANGSIDEFNLPKSVVHSLKIYQNLWESTHWSSYMSPSDFSEFPASDLVRDLISDMERILAAELKKYYPDSRVYVSVYDNGYKLIEIGACPSTGIHSTMVS